MLPATETVERMPPHRRIDWAAAFLLLALLVLAAYLRLHDLESVPGWYPDEGSNVAVAAALARGESSYLALGDSSFINGHPPLYYLGLALLFRLGGTSMVVARAWSVSLGLSTLLLLYGIVRRLDGKGVALLAAGFYALYPAAVVTSRMAFTYNLLPPLYLLTVYCLWRAAEGGRARWITAAALLTGMALLGDLVAAGLFAFWLLALLLTRPCTVLWAVPLALLPLLVWGLWMWRLAGPFFLQDVAFTLSRTGASLPVQVARLAFYRTILEGDLWLALGGVGLLVQRKARPRWLTAGLFAIGLLVVARNEMAFGQASYFLIPLLPLAAWGMGAMLYRGVPALSAVLVEDWRTALTRWRFPPRWRGRLAGWSTALILFVLLLLPAISMVAEGLWLDYRLYTSRFGATLVDPNDARQVTNYVNSRTDFDDVVLSSPTIAWLFTAHAADFQMTVAATGQATQHLPPDIPPARFRFDPRLDHATYAVLDPLWRGWGAAQMTPVADMVAEIEAEWHLEGCWGDLQVYRNPRRSDND